MDALSHRANADEEHRQPLPGIMRFAARVVNFFVEAVNVPGQLMWRETALQKSLDYKIRRAEKAVGPPKFFFLDPKHIFIERTFMTGRQCNAKAIAFLPHNLISEARMSVASLEYGWYPESFRGLNRSQRPLRPRVYDVDLTCHGLDPTRYDVIVQRHRAF